MKKLLSVAAILVAVTGMPGTAFAKSIPIGGNTPDKVKGLCGGGNNGTFWPPNDLGVYGCMMNNGHFIVCGGWGRYKKTCDLFRVGTKAPTRRAQTFLNGIRVRPPAN
jgi:hypothetical protein